MLHNLVSVSYWLEGGSSQAHSSLFELSFAAYFLVRGNLLSLFLCPSVTLKNAAELLEFATMYNAEQLKLSCLQFIVLNMAALLESK